MNIHLGTMPRDGIEYSGWFVGKFIKGTSICRTKRVEVKFSRHSTPFLEDGSTANRKATSLSFHLSGSFTYRFREGSKGKWKTVTLKRRGQYVLWGPGVFHSLKVSRSCEMIVVRWPSGGKEDKQRGPSPW